MEGGGHGKDESSIKPVSSLRSRFENLGKDAASTPSSPVGGRSPFLPPTTPSPDIRPITPLRESTWPGQAAAKKQEQNVTLPPRRLPSPIKSRPQSMISLSPTRQQGPLVTVDSPRSQDRKYLMSVDLTVPPSSAPLQSLTASKTGSESPTRLTAYTPTRATSPALETRINSVVRSLDPFKAASDGTHGAPPTPEVRPKIQTSSVPPPVNRAGKPQIPLKPTNLVKKVEGLSVPEPNADLTDQSISPFSTPPSSGKSSPRERKESDDVRGRHESDISLTQTQRGGSDASFVESVPSNSTTSSAQRGRIESDTSVLARARVGSNASFVEPSNLPDTSHHFQPPPVHHDIASRRDQQSNGFLRQPKDQSLGDQNRNGADGMQEDRPRLPVRPELQTRTGRNSPPKSRSGRTSPVKQTLERKSMDKLRQAATIDVQPPPQRIPAAKTRSALNQGFARSPSSPVTKMSHIPPEVPAPRRSLDRRREVASTTAVVTKAPIQNNAYDVEEELPTPSTDIPLTQSVGPSDYPDSTQANRRPPKFNYRPWHIATDYETRTFAVCGEYVCTTGHRTKAWNLRTGEQVLDLEHHEIIRVSALVFKPSPSPEDEGKRVWLGTSMGEIHELDIPSHSIVKTKSGAHARKDIIRMFRYASELWTLDDGGDLNVWKPEPKGIPSLDSSYKTFRTPRGHTFSIALGRHLWIACGKEIRVFAPGAASDTEFQVLVSPLSQPGTGDIHSGTTLSSKPGLVYFGHQDGKVSIYNRKDYSCVGVMSVSMYKLSSLAGAGDYLWAGFNTGMAYVYDTSTTPWKVKKDWQAHEKPICGISAERSAVWKMNRLQVVTLGMDNMLRIWNGMLEEDWLDSQMQEHDSEYCSFQEITATVLTWNAGASKPTYLSANREDSNFFREYMTDGDAPDIFVFGFQELVDLEDKKVTAKTFFKSKKKDANDQEHMSHQYRAWRDHLQRCLDEYMPASQTYALLHTASLVGLFTCVFVKTALRSRIKHVQAAEVKRGMGGMYGNKGALVLRMVLDDSSLCLVNCHLAAGQTQTINRNNDITSILEAEVFPTYPLNDGGVAQHADVFAPGGDGSMILDHEICILNGDLNYRIDTMGRDTVIKHIYQNNLARLLERDQLLLSRRRNPAFRLRMFQESEIRFAPTYKYDVHTDDYDSSEKRRSPAWCDRILYRGLGKVKMEEYRRWEVRASDHRPVSGRLRIRVKNVDAERREKVWETCQREFEALSKAVAWGLQLEYLTDVFGLSTKDATAALKG